MTPEPSNEYQELVEALEEIVTPIAFMQKRAEADGKRLDGMMANQIANDPEYLRGIARAALSALKLPHAGDDGWQDIATAKSLQIGDRIWVNADACPKEWGEDWRGVEAFVTSLAIAPEMPSGINVEICETWPPKKSERTDGFDPSWLVRLPAPPAKGTPHV